jgi:hypothetical protein
MQRETASCYLPIYITLTGLQASPSIWFFSIIIYIIRAYYYGIMMGQKSKARMKKRQ